MADVRITWHHEDDSVNLERSQKTYWTRLLRAWGERMDAYIAHPIADAEPYAYNERASVGFLAAGAWLAAKNAVAIEEFVVDKSGGGGRHKAASTGRCDLWVSFDEQHSYICEAKYDWCSLRRSKSQSLFSGVSTWLDEASDQAKTYAEAEDWTVALVFMVPYFAPGKSTLRVPRMTDDLERILGKDHANWAGHTGFRADYYPVQDREIVPPAGGGTWYPGTSLFGAFRIVEDDT